MLLVTIGSAILLAHPLAWLGPPIFLIYLTRLQIRPEERAMRARFGKAFHDYAAHVNRWL